MLPAYEILKMATVNAARAIGHAGELGVIKEGALADFILIDAVKPHLMPVYNMVANLIYCGKAADVDASICRTFASRCSIRPRTLPAVRPQRKSRLSRLPATE